MRQKKATKRTRLSAKGDAYVGGYRDEQWTPERPEMFMPSTPPASLMFMPGDVFDVHQQQDDPALVPLLALHVGGGVGPPPPWLVHGRPR